MKLPDFDPYELLGVDGDADAATIDRAYKVRIRRVHPDIAGSTGLHESKRLNLARDWLLDPELRAQLPRPRRRWGAAADVIGRRGGPREAPRGEPAATRHHPSWDWDVSSARQPEPSWTYDRLRDDPLDVDYGPATERLRALFAAIRDLSDDERARLTYSMGEERPGSFDELRDGLGADLGGRSRALHDAITLLWREREDDIAPLDFPKGPFYGGGPAVVNAYAQWQLLGEALRRASPDPSDLDELASTCTWPWEASVGQPRYGPRHETVSAFLRDARELPSRSAERLARAWQRDMGRFLYGTPGEDWFPGTRDHPRPDVVSARLAAVDVSRVEAPAGLAPALLGPFRNGLRLTGHVLALGGVPDAGRDYLRPWKEATDPSPSFFERARYGTPAD
jgi:curved DNA-binding protein CbpA